VSGRARRGWKEGANEKSNKNKTKKKTYSPVFFRRRRTNLFFSFLVVLSSPILLFSLSVSATITATLTSSTALAFRSVIHIYQIPLLFSSFFPPTFPRKCNVSTAPLSSPINLTDSPLLPVGIHHARVVIRSFHFVRMLSSEKTASAPDFENDIKTMKEGTLKGITTGNEIFVGALGKVYDHMGVVVGCVNENFETKMTEFEKLQNLAREKLNHSVGSKLGDLDRTSQQNLGILNQAFDQKTLSLNKSFFDASIQFENQVRQASEKAQKDIMRLSTTALRAEEKADSLETSLHMGGALAFVGGVGFVLFVNEMREIFEDSMKETETTVSVRVNELAIRLDEVTREYEENIKEFQRAAISFVQDDIQKKYDLLQNDVHKSSVFAAFSTCVLLAGGFLAYQYFSP